MSHNPTHPPTFAELKHHLIRDHGIRSDTLPMFSSEEGGPGLEYLENPATGACLPIGEFRDDEAVCPSMIDYVARRLEIDVKDISVVCQDGNAVSIKLPVAANAGQAGANAKPITTVRDLKAAAKRPRYGKGRS